MKKILGDGDYGFINFKDMPKGDFSEKTIPLNNLNFACTGDFNDIAKNHCGAVCALNIVLILSQKEMLSMGESSLEKFREIHKIIGNGPTPSIARGLLKYAQSHGVKLNYQSDIKSFEDVKAAIHRGNPCGILLANAVLDWHWVTCVGYREYQNGEKYIRIADGWSKAASRFYKLNTGSAWISATEYFVESGIDADSKA